MNDFLKRDFHLSDVLSALTGRLLSNRGRNGMSDIHGYLTGDPSITDIGEAMQEERVRKIILEQYPQLGTIELPQNVDDINDAGERERIWLSWVDEQIKRFGETLSIRPAEIPLRINADEIADYMKDKNPHITVLKL